MKTNLLSSDKDPMGTAIADYFNHNKADKLRVFSSQFEEDEIPVNQLFRPYDEMPELEQIALQMAEGNILDVEAGSGCHALALQEMGKEVCAIDISPRSVEVMEKRGVRNVRQMNLFDPHFLETFDTILMLMNGSGIIGKLENMAAFFQKMKQLLRPGGCILMDSSDLRYLFEDEDGSFLIDLAGDYYGEIDFRMQYKNIKGDSFDWLYVDFQTLSLYAAGNGFEAELIKEGEHYDYLTRLRWEGMTLIERFPINLSHDIQILGARCCVSCPKKKNQAIEPPTISNSSLVIACWRLLLYITVRSCNKSFALSVAICIAIVRAACSEAFESSNTVNIFIRSTFGSNSPITTSTDGSTI